MKKKTALIIQLFLWVLLSEAYGQQMNAELKNLRLLRGSWEMSSPEGKIVEVWRNDSPVKLSGKSFRVSTGNDSTLLERMEIVRNKGKLFFIPVVTGQNEGKAVRFVLKSNENGKYIFENRSHDFPQRVVYHLLSPNELLAWIEGSNKGREQKIEFRYRRTGMQ